MLPLAFAALASCSSSNSLGTRYSPAHVWVLQSVDGVGLPYVRGSDIAGYTSTIFDTLTIDIATDTARDNLLAVDSFPGQAPVELHIGLNGIYTLKSDSVRIRWLAVCPPVCVANIKGSINGNSMTLTPDAAVSPGVLSMYTRIR